MSEEIARFDWSTFQDLKEEKRTERTRERRPDLERLAQAEPAAKLLTDSEPWNQALSLMETKAQDLEKSISETQDVLSTTILEDPQVRTIYVRLVCWRGQLDVLREVMELPAKMRATGQEAARLLKEADVVPEA